MKDPAKRALAARLDSLLSSMGSGTENLTLQRNWCDAFAEVAAKYPDIAHYAVLPTYVGGTLHNHALSLHQEGHDRSLCLAAMTARTSELG